ncbi:MAG: endonuclease/exonuclease/phosphatase family protein [Bacteroidales bacterium]
MKYKRNLFIIACISILSIMFCFMGEAQITVPEGGNAGNYTVMFWNLENYFDPFDDPATSDDEFTPFGGKFWSWKKYVTKRNNIAKVIISAGEKNSKGEVSYPSLIALAEVENRFVVEQLVRSTPLALVNYGVIHRDSPDERGIDVALLYRKDVFRPLSVEFLYIHLPDSSFKTRLILYTKGVLEDLDTLHIFVNHWPSKFGGEAISQPKRRAAADALKFKCDSIFVKNTKANILLTGDFNDTPDSQVFKSINNFMNLSWRYFSIGEGTIKYRGKWELIDQFFVSENLLNKSEPIFCDSCSMKIYRPGFLMEKDREFLGERPKRSYIGPRYNGGISDHLPVILSIRRM